jgi:predicted phosphoadenosine phosphosulfate sulfurtransferase
LNIKRELDKDVLTAARERIAHIWDTCDSIAVAFSGGKDSLVVLHLALDEAKRRGTLPLRVVFRDEELIPNEVIDFVDSYRRRDDIAMDWYAVPLKSTKFVLGRTMDYIQWDPSRPWVRQKPNWAISDSSGQVFDQYTMDAFCARDMKGKVCLLNGIRADESPVRLRACLNKMNECYISATASKRVVLGKPIYDWKADDVFRFLWERKITYCPFYDRQQMSGADLRISTPIHSENAKRISNLRVQDPEFYDRVLQVFPDMATQDRYWKDYSQDAIVQAYSDGWDGILRYIDENLEGQQWEMARRKVEGLRKAAVKRPDWFPLNQVLRWVIRGGFKRSFRC